MRTGPLDEGALVCRVLCLPRLVAGAEPPECGVELRFRLANRPALHRPDPSPGLRRFVQSRGDGAPVRLLARPAWIQRARSRSSTCRRFSALSARSARLRLEIDAARFIGGHGGLIEPLPVRFGIHLHALADGLPLRAQFPDALGQSGRWFLGPGERLHLADQLGAFGRDGVILPFLECTELGIELLQSARQWGRQGRERSESFLDRTTQARGRPAVAGAQRAVSPGDEIGELSQGMGLGRCLLGARILLGTPHFFGRGGGLGRRFLALTGQLCRLCGRFLARGLAGGLFGQPRRVLLDFPQVLGLRRMAAGDVPHRRALAPTAAPGLR